MEDFVKLSLKAGLHGRPGALLVDLSKKNPKVKIALEKNGKRAEANSILSLLALGVKRGDQVRVSVSGENESAILQEVKSILEGSKV